MTMPAARPRTAKTAKRAGAAFETETAQYLELMGLHGAYRRHTSGAVDKGDVAILGMPEFLAECKYVPKLSLGYAFTETEAEAKNASAEWPVLVHKRHGKGQPQDQWVTTDLETLANILLTIHNLRQDLAYYQRLVAGK